MVLSWSQYSAAIFAGGPDGERIKVSRGLVSINLPSIAIVDGIVFPDWRACLHPILLNDEMETSSLGGILRPIRVARARASDLIVAI